MSERSFYEQLLLGLRAMWVGDYLLVRSGETWKTRRRSGDWFLGVGFG